MMGKPFHEDNWDYDEEEDQLRFEERFEPTPMWRHILETLGIALVLLMWMFSLLGLWAYVFE